VSVLVIMDELVVADDDGGVRRVASLVGKMKNEFFARTLDGTFVSFEEMRETVAFSILWHGLLNTGEFAEGGIVASGWKW